ncbi:MAG: DUF4143 domain-containing protein, partial [Alphaproteobacteria bacterium]|nr:DUF4143 domain-containing protein [Alphaproteobacteria bacterium]
LQYPLQSFEIENNLRIYPNDIGLLICTYPFELKAEILRDNNTDEKAENIILQTAKGGIYEALAADFLHKAKFQNLHFYRNEAGTVEMEFLIESTQGIIPVEIKAGRKGSRSLNTILSDNTIKYGYKFSSQNIGTINKKVTMPLYMMMFLGKEV